MTEAVTDEVCGRGWRAAMALATSGLVLAGCGDAGPPAEPDDGATPVDAVDVPRASDTAAPIDTAPEVDAGPPPPPTGDGVFAEGCPVAGEATARVIGTPGLAFEGPDAVGGEGDYLLMNEHVAIVITAPGTEKTYYHYGGILADAVTLDGCAKATDDELEETGLVIVEPAHVVDALLGGRAIVS